MAKAKEPFPMDRGWAWVIVWGCFMCVFVMVGMTKSTGIFLNYFQDYFEISTSLASMVMGGSGIVYAFMSPMCIMLAQLFSIRQVVMAGGVIGCIGFALSSFLFSVEYIIVCFGFFFGLGNATVYGNCLVILGLYFHKKRSLANGLALCGSSLGQFALPPLIELLLEAFGLSGCLLVIGAIYLHITVGGCLFRPVDSWAKGGKSSQVRKTLLRKKAEENGQLSHTLTNNKVISQDPSQEDDTLSSHRPAGSASCDEVVPSENGINKDCDSPQMPLISSPAESFPMVRNCVVQGEEGVGGSNPSTHRRHTTAEVGCDGEASADPESVCLARKSSSSTVDDREFVSEKVLGYRSHYASTGSLCIQPLYGSTILIERVQGLEKEEEEDKKDAGKLFHKMIAMFDFSVMKSYVAVMITVVNFLAFFGYFNFVLFLPATLVFRGIDKYDKAILVSVTGVGDLLGRLTMALVGDREFMSRYKMQALGLLAVGLTIGMLIWVESYWWMLVLCGLYGYFGGIHVSLTAVVIIDFVGVRHLPRLLSVVMLIQGVGVSIGQPMLGAVRDASGSFHWVLAITATCCLVSCFMLLSYPFVVKLEYRRPERFRLLPPTKDFGVVLEDDTTTTAAAAT